MASPIRERGLDGRIRIRIREVNQLRAGSGLSIAASLLFVSFREECIMKNVVVNESKR